MPVGTPPLLLVSVGILTGLVGVGSPLALVGFCVRLIPAWRTLGPEVRFRIGLAWFAIDSLEFVLDLGVPFGFVLGFTVDGVFCLITGFSSDRFSTVPSTATQRHDTKDS